MSDFGSTADMRPSCIPVAPPPRDSSAKCGGRRHEKRFKIRCLREPHQIREVGRFGDKRAERENFGVQPAHRSAEVSREEPPLLAIQRGKIPRRMLVAERLAEGEGFELQLQNAAYMKLANQSNIESRLKCMILLKINQKKNVF